MHTLIRGTEELRIGSGAVSATAGPSSREQAVPGGQYPTSSDRDFSSAMARPSLPLPKGTVHFRSDSLGTGVQRDPKRRLLAVDKGLKPQGTRGSEIQVEDPLEVPASRRMHPGAAQIYRDQMGLPHDPITGLPQGLPGITSAPQDAPKGPPSSGSTLQSTGKGSSGNVSTPQAASNRPSGSISTTGDAPGKPKGMEKILNPENKDPPKPPKGMEGLLNPTTTDPPKGLSRNAPISQSSQRGKGVPGETSGMQPSSQRYGTDERAGVGSQGSSNPYAAAPRPGPPPVARHTDTAFSQSRQAGEPSQAQQSRGAESGARVDPRFDPASHDQNVGPGPARAPSWPAGAGATAAQPGGSGVAAMTRPQEYREESGSSRPGKQGQQGAGQTPGTGQGQSKKSKRKDTRGGKR